MQQARERNGGDRFAMMLDNKARSASVQPKDRDNGIDR
jgi:hypothetical protein